MRLYCVWCRTWLSGSDVCAVLPAGCLWPVGAAVCLRCCPHGWHTAGRQPPGG
jgi:hypothetical protein